MRWGLVVAVLMMAPSVWAAQLRDLRLWDGPESTRIVFDLSDDVRYTVFTLANPDRVVVDLDGLSPKEVARIEGIEGKGLVQRLRSGPRGDGVRVVFDVASTVFVNNFELPPSDEYGHRLVVDLARPGLQPDVMAAPDSTAVAATEVQVPAPAPVVESKPDLVAETAQPPAVVARVKDKPIIVAVDAGHGGEDPGARGKSGLQEKDVALAIARNLADMINKTPNMRAVLTRKGDYYVGLRERVNIARKNQADLFVSVHCNAFTRRDLEGTAVYVLSDRGATSEHARWLAHKENAADLVGGVELHGKDNELAAVLIDLSQGATMEASFDVGSRILNSMSKVNRLQKSEIQQAGFAVLKAPDIPSVLVETAFITNPREEKLLASKDYQAKFARQIFDGVSGYFQSYRPKQQMVENEPGLQYVSLADNRDTAAVTQGVSR
ncbi:AMIN domain-containing protein [Sinimarinibacterium sp. CAU 1509]|uniref:N-acetylmuramoyl-L-alanine amidase n=1 Tax=Sinimarinibacterium sp. CAU 1509 TaxID=2562283 RepID=UPI0010AD0DAD|nr:N-acetylmuramoyl-L-alanine amidase [Sinimarinibacterium sp. CAU 1509]TJY60929.1 AMIN domain-containing protein [Sinimarinibacterium sp. CAU 1509]